MRLKRARDPEGLDDAMKPKRGRPKGNKWYYSLNSMTDQQVVWYALTELQRKTTISELCMRLDKIKIRLLEDGELGTHRNAR